MRFDARHTAVLALHWQVNVVDQEGYFGPMLGPAVQRSGVRERAAQLHRAAQDAGVPVYFTRFVLPEDGGLMAANTPMMQAVAGSAAQFRPDAPGSELVEEARALAAPDRVIDNQKLSGLAGSALAERLTAGGIDTLLITGVATNLTFEQTARHASDLGFTVHPVADCTTAQEEPVHRASLANLALTTAGLITAADAGAGLAAGAA